jgi:hypothetical protein
MHGFWAMEGQDRQNERIHFLKNLGLLGGALVFLAVPVDAWPLAVWSVPVAVLATTLLTPMAGRAVPPRWPDGLPAAAHPPCRTRRVRPAGRFCPQDAYC